MKQVTTVRVAGGRITVAHLRTTLRISTAGNVKSGHASESAFARGKYSVPYSEQVVGK